MCPSLHIKYSQIWRSLQRQRRHTAEFGYEAGESSSESCPFFCWPINDWKLFWQDHRDSLNKILVFWVDHFFRFYLLWIEFYWGFGFVFGLFGNFGFKGWHVFGFCLQFKTKSRHFGWEGIVIGDVAEQIVSDEEEWVDVGDVAQELWWLGFLLFYYYFF